MEGDRRNSDIRHHQEELLPHLLKATGRVLSVTTDSNVTQQRCLDVDKRRTYREQSIVLLTTTQRSKKTIAYRMLDIEHVSSCRKQLLSF